MNSVTRGILLCNHIQSMVLSKHQVIDVKRSYISMSEVNGSKLKKQLSYRVATN